MRRRGRTSQVIINTKFWGCPRKMGAPGPRLSPVMSPLCQCTLLAQAPLAGKGILTREIPYRCTLRKQGPYPRSISTKNDDDVHFIRVLQCLFAFSWPCRYTLSGLRSVQRCVSLVMHPLIGFSSPCTLRTKISLRPLFYAGSGGVRSFRLNGA